MKVVCISDTHMSGMPLHEYPNADILIHAGDATYRGTEREIAHFAKELSKHYKNSRHHDGYQRIYFVPGNHDWLFEKEEAKARQILLDYNIITLINESDTYQGVKIWGSPVCPPFHNWAFYRGSEDRKDLWSYIPDDTDILVTHGPPMYMRDEVFEYMKSKYTGCEHLAERVKIVKPKVHVFGHIHEGYGVTKGNNTLFVNAAIMDGRYVPDNGPILIDLTDGVAEFCREEYEHYDGHMTFRNIHVPYNVRNY